MVAEFLRLAANSPQHSRVHSAAGLFSCIIVMLFDKPEGKEVWKTGL